MRNLFKIIAAALLLAFAPRIAAAEAAPTVTVAHPLLWEIDDGAARVYLFGSIHVMKPDTVWLSDDLQRRFDSAGQAWFEVADLDDQAAVQQQAQRYMLDPSGHMTAGLTPAEVVRLDALLAPYGLGSAQMMGYRKWAVALVLNVQQIAAAGYNPKTGVDLTLLQQARATGKPVHGFETIDQEMQKLAPADDAEDMAALRSAIADSATSAQDIADLFQAWANGDEKRLTSFMVDKMKAESPSLYRRVIVERDAAWTPQVERLVRDLKAQGGGTAFVTVGVGHLVGPDSLIAMLRADGAKVKQVE
ncbi:MAG TPA: TraB/GumN family protein [Asticcacaulis sp.]